jgi:hypothetical protein
MTKANRLLHIADLERQEPDNTTNIWGGIFESLEALRDPPTYENESHRTKTVMLLTDGVPNKNPKGGILNALIDYKDQYPRFAF